MAGSLVATHVRDKVVDRSGWKHFHPLNVQIHWWAARLQKHLETFSFMVLLPIMSLGDRFCVSRKGGAGEVLLKDDKRVVV